MKPFQYSSADYLPRLSSEPKAISNQQSYLNLVQEVQMDQSAFKFFYQSQEGDLTYHNYISKYNTRRWGVQLLQ